MTTPDDTTRLGSSTTPPRAAADGRFVAGTVLAGRYRVVSLLGRGGMGEVSGTFMLLAIVGSAAYATYLAIGSPPLLPRRQTI